MAVHSPLLRTSRPFPPSAPAHDLERLYREHATSLLAFLLRHTDDHELAEDVVAETFVRLLRHWERYDDGRASEQAWMRAIGLNCLRTKWRRDAVERRVLATFGTAEARPAPTDEIAERDAVERARRTLTLVEREAIVMHYDLGLRVREISVCTGRPVATIESRLTRALSKLRAELTGCAS